MRKSCLQVVGAAVVALISGCGSTASPNSTSPKLGVLSSITDGAALSDPVLWTARPVHVTDKAVARVEFLIDGHVRWTATTPPYAFDLSDGDIAKRLFP